jgi:hypothetical protein
MPWLKQFKMPICQSGRKEPGGRKHVTYYYRSGLCDFAYFLVLLHDLLYPCLFINLVKTRQETFFLNYQRQ